MPRVYIEISDTKNFKMQIEALGHLLVDAIIKVSKIGLCVLAIGGSNSYMVKWVWGREAMCKVEGMDGDEGFDWGINCRAFNNVVSYVDNDRRIGILYNSDTEPNMIKVVGVDPSNQGSKELHTINLMDINQERLDIVDTMATAKIELKNEVLKRYCTIIQKVSNTHIRFRKYQDRIVISGAGDITTSEFTVSMHTRTNAGLLADSIRVDELPKKRGRKPLKHIESEKKRKLEEEARREELVASAEEEQPAAEADQEATFDAEFQVKSLVYACKSADPATIVEIRLVEQNPMFATFQNGNGCYLQVAVAPKAE